MELLCPAGSMPALKAALDNGADAIYVGLRNDTNARNFSGLNLTKEDLQQAVNLVHKHKRRLHVAINTFAQPTEFKRWQSAVDDAVQGGADVLILADISLLAYAAERYPEVERHLSVQASATNAAAIEFYQRNYQVSRVVLPRVLSMPQVAAIARTCSSELEVFAFGSLCIMAEGRCYLSSYMTGESPNNSGACSPAKYVRWEEHDGILESRLNDYLIDRFMPEENAGYPTLCKGRFNVGEARFHVLEEPTSLNTLDLLPSLHNEGIKAVKIEGRQRSPAYIAQVTRVWRSAIDQVLANPQSYQVKQEWSQVLAGLSEGSQTTLGAFHRHWR
ncbi:ubiquinone anaerobic biosynthesis protein UbiU [Cellvibrio polysaccharolyticus]|uniref:Ubiquinone biosynthesis protein UbiU n=1 Tax=Cellvibrio polysaccharolyticus TaxID=2082724 RepID=A0A928V6W4_9GAMM|nr:peptidase U32 family protein [Cellvibrio polysaccharolyticus]MBE8718250.1 U32 family peptidase [Cellvibrio polysaccharolyticus]